METLLSTRTTLPPLLQYALAITTTFLLHNSHTRNSCKITAMPTNNNWEYQSNHNSHVSIKAASCTLMSLHTRIMFPFNEFLKYEQSHQATHLITVYYTHVMPSSEKSDWSFFLLYKGSAGNQCFPMDKTT